MYPIQASLDPYTLLLAAVTALAAYFGYRTNSPPAKLKQSAGKSRAKDSLQSYGLVLFLLNYRYFVAVSGVLHVAFILLNPVRPTAFCPSPANLSPYLFSWNAYTIAALTFMIGGGILRVAAYLELDKNYTFELAKPSNLVTSGPYKYIQHPGYTGGWSCMLGISLLFGRFDGGIGCFVPFGWTTPLTVVHFLVVSSVMVFIFRVRVTEEERMLEKAFGEEWKRYSRSTKRFIPGIV